MHIPTLAIGVASIALILALRWLKRLIGWRLLPEFLIVVIVMAAVTAQLGLGRSAASRSSATSPPRCRPRSCRRSTRPYLRDLAGSALAIALLGLLEAISMAKAIAAVTGQKLDMNQQCLSEGVANFDRQLLPVHAGLGLADALGDQPAGGRADAVVGRRLGGGGRAHHAGVRALRALHPALGAGRPADAHRGAHGEPARPALPRARVALRRASSSR